MFAIVFIFVTLKNFHNILLKEAFLLKMLVLPFQLFSQNFWSLALLH